MTEENKVIDGQLLYQSDLDSLEDLEDLALLYNRYKDALNDIINICAEHMKLTEEQLEEFWNDWV